ncbi:MAG: glycosyltransferase family 4 protein [Candidatus Thermoplasmatota archaeon]|nr:glycosyltransferase family 4 protein [Candidatus Thermoplasmatota archaeon]MDD5778360.1 glycosyltransferase family 4 protein [Candidatus Thermoplasmatota archaeon]
MVNARRNTKILYLYIHDRSFVRRDLKMLERHFHVKPFYFTKKSFFRLLSSIKNCDVLFVWFASYHALIGTFLACLFKKKIVVVTGGYDVANEPEINYGLLRSRFFKGMVKFVLNRANKILAVSEFNDNEIKKYLGIKKAQIVYNSVDPKRFYPKGEKEPMVLTVGFITWENVKRKGLDTFVKAASHVSEAKFVVIGKGEKEPLAYLKSIAPKNVDFTGFVPDDKLLEYYQKAKVYCQLSFYESFGMAPAEGMLCECVPVVARRGALPEVVGDTGFFVPYGDVQATAEAVQEALASSRERGRQARDRVIRLFSPEMREEKLADAVAAVLE